MAKMWKLCIVVVLLAMFSVSALAVSEVTDAQANAVLDTDGSCQVTLTVQLHMDTPAQMVWFPLPADAADISLNGSYVTTQPNGDKLLVALPNLSAGDYHFTLRYTLPQVVTKGENLAQISLPLLSGFGYPIRALTCTVTLPGDVAGKPSFTSGYHQEDIERNISVQIQGNQITAQVLQPLKDHETLHMALPAEAALFPNVPGPAPLIDLWDGMMLVCLLLAVVYYLLTLMPQLPTRSRCFTPPDGIHAGEVGMTMTGTGVDLTLMVFSWAQLGYLQMELRGKKVFLHKQMDMGNERRDFEVQAFRALFGGRRIVEGTGMHYARLYRRTAVQRPMLRQLFRPTSGRPGLFRILSCAAGGISAVKLGLALTDHSVLRVLLAIVCCGLCGTLSYFIQTGGKCLPLRNKTPMAVALGCGAAWVVLGVLAHRTGAVVPMVLFQLLAGIAIAFGGRRSELGKRSLAQIRGLRRYMVHANTFELQQRLQANSNYFYELAPYALALGVDRRFARRFGKTELVEKSSLICKEPPVTAAQWAATLRQIADLLNARQKRLPYEQITGKS